MRSRGEDKGVRMRRVFSHDRQAHRSTIDQILVLKSVVAMATLALVLVGALYPQFASDGVSWGQGIVASIGGILGGYLSLHK